MNAHQIKVLKVRKIIEIGNHEKLMEKRGQYFDLVDKQMGVWATTNERRRKSYSGLKEEKTIMNF